MTPQFRLELQYFRLVKILTVSHRCHIFLGCDTATIVRISTFLSPRCHIATFFCIFYIYFYIYIYLYIFLFKQKKAKNVTPCDTNSPEHCNSNDSCGVTSGVTSVSHVVNFTKCDTATIVNIPTFRAVLPKMVYRKKYFFYDTIYRKSNIFLR